MQLTFKGRVFATPSAVTIIQDGVEIFSGMVGLGQPLDTEIDLFQTTIPQPTRTGNAVPADTTYSISMATTSGVITAGDVTVTLDDGVTPIYEPGSGPDLRQNILVNGALPDWPATPVDPMPGGTESDPNWQGWFFEQSAGESMTYTFTVYGKQIPQT
jgi:hypothetical protein